MIKSKTKTPDGNRVVSAFFIDQKTYKKIVDVFGRSDVPSSNISSVESDIATAQTHSEKLSWRTTVSPSHLPKEVPGSLSGGTTALNHELLWKAGAKKNLADLPSQQLREEDGGSTLISALKEARDQKEPYLSKTPISDARLAEESANLSTSASK